MIKACVVCGDDFRPRKNTNTCSEECRQVRLRDRKLASNVNYKERHREEINTRSRKAHAANPERRNSLNRQSALKNSVAIRLRNQRYNARKNAALRAIRELGIQI